MKRREAVRFSLLLAAALLFAGLLVLSILQVRYSVQGAEKGEWDVVEYTLADSLKRGQNGGLRCDIRPEE